MVINAMVLPDLEGDPAPDRSAGSVSGVPRSVLGQVPAGL